MNAKDNIIRAQQRQIDDLEKRIRDLEAQLVGAADVIKAYQGRDRLQEMIRRALEDAKRQVEYTRRVRDADLQQIEKLRSAWGNSDPYNVQLLLGAYNDVARDASDYFGKLASDRFTLPGDEQDALREIAYLNVVAILDLVSHELLEYAIARIPDPTALCKQVLAETKADGAPMMRTLQALKSTGWIDAHIQGRRGKPPKLGTLADALRLCAQRRKEGLGITEFVRQTSAVEERQYQDYEAWYKAIEREADFPDRLKPE